MNDTTNEMFRRFALVDEVKICQIVYLTEVGIRGECWRPLTPEQQEPARNWLEANFPGTPFIPAELPARE